MKHDPGKHNQLTCKWQNRNINMEVKWHKNLHHNENGIFYFFRFFFFGVFKTFPSFTDSTLRHLHIQQLFTIQTPSCQSSVEQNNLIFHSFLKFHANYRTSITLKHKQKPLKPNLSFIQTINIQLSWNNISISFFISFSHRQKASRVPC